MIIPLRVESSPHRDTSAMRMVFKEGEKIPAFLHALSQYSLPSHEKTKMSDLPKDGYLEGLSLLQLKEVAGTSGAHLTLGTPVVAVEYELEIPIQGLPPEGLSHGPQRLPVEAQWWSCTPGSTERRRPADHMSTLSPLGYRDRKQ